MKIKKVLALLLAAIMTAVLFAGCAAQSYNGDYSGEAGAVPSAPNDGDRKSTRLNSSHIR